MEDSAAIESDLNHLVLIEGAIKHFKTKKVNHSEKQRNFTRSDIHFRSASRPVFVYSTTETAAENEHRGEAALHKQLRNQILQRKTQKRTRAPTLNVCRRCHFIRFTSSKLIHKNYI